MHLMSELTGWFSHSGTRWRPYPHPSAALRVGQPHRPRKVRHRMIAASRVIGVAVLGADGQPGGEIRDLSIDKSNGQVAYALVAHGGFLGLAEHIFPVPWMLLRYDPEKDAFHVPFGEATAKAAPGLKEEDLEWFGAGDEAWRAKLAAYYSPYLQAAFL